MEGFLYDPTPFSSYLKDLYSSYSRASCCQHWIQQYDVAVRDVLGQLLVVKDCGLILSGKKYLL